MAFGAFINRRLSGGCSATDHLTWLHILQRDRSVFKRATGAPSRSTDITVAPLVVANLHTKLPSVAARVIPAGRKQFVDIDLVALRGGEVLPAIGAVAAGRVRMDPNRW